MNLSVYEPQGGRGKGLSEKEGITLRLEAKALSVQVCFLRKSLFS